MSSRAVAARLVPNASWVIWVVVRTRCSCSIRSSHRSRAVSRAASAASSPGLRASRPLARSGRTGLRGPVQGGVSGHGRSPGVTGRTVAGGRAGGVAAAARPAGGAVRAALPL